MYAVTYEIGQSKLVQYHLAQNAQRNNREQRKDDANHFVLPEFITLRKSGATLKSIVATRNE